VWLQNATPIPIATKSYSMSALPVLTGNLMGAGQYADLNLFFMRTISRA
jgi:hypothetical protein